MDARGKDGLSMGKSFKETKEQLKTKGMVFGHENTRKQGAPLG